jgi:hypothetical protein
MLLHFPYKCVVAGVIGVGTTSCRYVLVSLGAMSGLGGSNL